MLLRTKWITSKGSFGDERQHHSGYVSAKGGADWCAVMQKELTGYQKTVQEAEMSKEDAARVCVQLQDLENVQATLQDTEVDIERADSA